MVKTGSIVVSPLGAVLIACLGLFAVPVGTGADETIYCTQYIASVPYTITQAGHYCLIRNVTSGMASGTAIRIAADNVWLDLNNFALDASAAGSGTTAWGISAENRSHVTVRNGLVLGFLNGVVFDGDASTSDLTVEKIRADKNTRSGILVRGGEGIVVRENRVANTGGTTLVNLTGTTGLAIVGTATVVNNEVVNTFTVNPQPGNLAYGIAFGGPPGAEYKAVAIDNRVTNSTDVGIACNQPPTSEVVLRDNIVVGAPAAYAGACTPIGTTNYP